MAPRGTQAALRLFITATAVGANAIHFSSQFVAASLFCAALAACGGGGDTDAGGGGGSTSTVAASGVVGAGGGTVAVTDASSPIAGTRVVIPAGALSQPTTITISQVTGAAGVPGDVLVAEVGPAGTVFAVPVAVTIRYAPQYLSSNGIGDATTLKVVAMTAAAANETLRTVSQDTGRNTVSAQSARLGRFAVLGYTNATLSGTYGFNFTIVDPRFGTPDPIAIDVPALPFVGSLGVPFPAYAFSTEVGTITFNGAGGYAWSGVRNVAGAPRAVSGSGSYSVDADGRMALDIGPSGSVLAGGSTFILTSTSGDVVEMGMGVRQSGAFGNASLSGGYAVAKYSSDANARPLGTIGLDIRKTPFSGTFDVPFPAIAFSAERGTLTFNGAGAYAWSGTRNRGGVSSAVSGSGSYAVAADGTLTLDTGLTGNVLAGGSTFVLAMASGQPTEVGVGLKQGGTFGNESLGGTYAVSYHYVDAGTGPPATIDIDVPSTPYSGSLTVPFPGSAFNAELHQVTFNGAGGYLWSGTRNRGGVTSPVSGSGTYAVAADGALTLSSGLVGNVLAGGSTFILASTSGPRIEIGVGILR